MKFRPAGAVLFYAERRTNGQSDTTKLIVAHVQKQYKSAKSTFTLSPNTQTDDFYDFIQFLQISCNGTSDGTLNDHCVI